MSTESFWLGFLLSSTIFVPFSYMGIGLSVQGVNMNRLPGWDKNSFGYHGDDGHSFCSSGTGHSYGPTFTTGKDSEAGCEVVDWELINFI